MHSPDRFAAPTTRNVRRSVRNSARFFGRNGCGWVRHPLGGAAGSRLAASGAGAGSWGLAPRLVPGMRVPRLAPLQVPPARLEPEPGRLPRSRSRPRPPASRGPNPQSLCPGVPRSQWAPAPARRLVRARLVRARLVRARTVSARTVSARTVSARTVSARMRSAGARTVPARGPAERPEPRVQGEQAPEPRGPVLALLVPEQRPAGRVLPARRARDRPERPQ